MASSLPKNPARQSPTAGVRIENAAQYMRERGLDMQNNRKWWHAIGYDVQYVDLPGGRTEIILICHHTRPNVRYTERELREGQRRWTQFKEAVLKGVVAARQKMLGSTVQSIEATEVTMSGKASYTSAYEARGPITTAQYLAELACERIAAHEGKQLAARFWQLPAWRKTFATQIRFANQLLKLYDEVVIIKGLRAAPRVRSLGAPFFHDDLAEIQRIEDLNRQRAIDLPVVNDSNTTEKPRPGVRRGGLRSKLNE